jgi:hypothetical protein
MAVEQINVFKNKHPSARIVVVANTTDMDLAFQAGGAGYLVSDISSDAFVNPSNR